MDHTAYDAYMFLIEATDSNKPDGKKVILHTGDFRGHGRSGKRILEIIKYYVHKNGRKVDVLVSEGTIYGIYFREIMEIAKNCVYIVDIFNRNG